jgi:hypothetical protein
LRRTIGVVVFTCTASIATSSAWKNFRGLVEASTLSLVIVEMMTTR